MIFFFILSFSLLNFVEVASPYSVIGSSAPHSTPGLERSQIFGLGHTHSIAAKLK